MTMEEFGTYAAGIALILGGFFALVGSFGLIKLNNPMARLHAPTKVGTMGIGSLLLASMIYAFTFGEGSLHELLIMGFLFVTAPISANFISKVNIHRRTCDTPPEAPDDQKWSTLTDEAAPEGTAQARVEA
ncbi:MAG: monovalent cation/H(+) antiporter subunit G [Pseudomonadota bacterium]